MDTFINIAKIIQCSVLYYYLLKLFYIYHVSNFNGISTEEIAYIFTADNPFPPLKHIISNNVQPLLLKIQSGVVEITW
jgi:hypothetical protein